MKRGTVRSDGMVFYKYSGDKGRWMSSEDYVAKVSAKRDYQRMCYRKYRERNRTLRKFGDIHESTGLRYIGVGSSGKEIWRDEKFFLKRREALRKSKRDYLRRIRGKSMYKVRFHLAPGENFMKWQVRSPDGSRKYYDPDKFSLRMRGCRLHNSRKTAERIHRGGSKTVCAWISCESLVVRRRGRASGLAVRYNPRVKPYWHSADGENLDSRTFRIMSTCGKAVYAGS